MTAPRQNAHLVSPNWPRHALGHACLLALAGFGSVALAAPNTGNFLRVTNAVLPSTSTAGTSWSGDYKANYSLVSDNPQIGFGVTNAALTGTVFESVLNGGGAVPISVSNNTAQALAFGNQNTATGGLGLLASSGGVLLLNLQSLSASIIAATTDPVAEASVGTLSATASVSGAVARIEQTGMASADLALDSNTLKASTQLNQADLLAAGVVPSGYSSSATGGSVVVFGTSGATATTTGSANLGNLQSSFSASPSATLSGSSVALGVSATALSQQGDETASFSSAASVSANQLAATTGVNMATSIFRAQAGSSSWNGSVSVTNLQNAAAASGDSTSSLASVSGSSVSADLRNGTGQTDLAGSLTLSSNQISASSIGNAAGARTSSGAISAGNAVLFEGSADITGSGSGTNSTVALANGTAQSVADVTLLNAQANMGSEFTTSVAGAGVSGQLDNLAGGSLTQNANVISATSTANLAGNLVNAGLSGAVANITASVAALNVQSNTTLNSTSSLTGSSISAVVGGAGAVPSGSVSLSDNTLAATADGNLGVTTVALKAANLTVSNVLGNTPTQGVTVNALTGAASTGLGVVAVNVQANTGTDTDANDSLTASNEGSSVTLGFNTQTTDELGADNSQAVGISTLNATLAGNVLKASGTANSASTSVALTSTQSTGLSAAVGNSQSNSRLDVVANAGANTPLAVSLTAGSVDSSSLTLTGNTLSAAAAGNVASGSLAATLGDVSGSTLVTATPQAAVSGEVVTARADLAVANAQRNDNASFTAGVSGSIALSVGNVNSATDPVAASTLTVSANRIQASADANRATTSLSADAVNLTGMAAALASRQGTSATILEASTAGTVTLDAGSVTDSSLTANGNQIAASTLANAASNRLSLAATTATGNTAALSSAASAGDSATTVAADVSLANLQASSGDTLSASTGSAATSAGVTMDVGAVSAGSALSLSSNNLVASTAVNSGSSALNLTVGALTGMSSGLASAQSIAGGSAGAETQGALSLSASSLSSATASATGNAITSTVYGNSADNALALTATTASGRGTAPMITVGTSVGATGDMVLANNQQVVGSTENVALSATTTGVALISTSQGDVSASALTLGSNTLSAYSNANVANNALSLSVNDLSQTTAALISRQQMDKVTVTATTNALVGVATGDATASTVSMADNTVKATAVGNASTSQLELTAANATGATATSGVPDLTLVNVQTSSIGLIRAVNGDVSSMVSLTAGDVAAASALGVARNTLGAMTSVNSASNVLALDAGSLNAMRAGLYSTQTVDATQVDTGAMAATIGQIGVTAASVSGSTMAVMGNALSATVYGNSVDNSASLAGTQVVGRATAPAATAGSAVAVVGDLALGNLQRLEGGSEGVVLGSTAIGPIQIRTENGSVANSALTLSGNSISAYTGANSATNQLELAVTDVSDTTVGMVSRQVLDNATVSSRSIGMALVETGAVTASSLTLSGNTVKSTALGNAVNNALRLAGTNATGTSATVSSAASASAGTDASAVGDVALANLQNSQDVTLSATTLGGVEMAVGSVGTGSALTLSGNTVGALAQSNSASNTLALAATQLSGLSAAVASSQATSGVVTATAEPVSTGALAISATSVTGTPVVLSGNAVTAAAGMNEAFNTLSASGTTVLGRGGSPVSAVESGSTTGVDFSVVNAQQGSGVVTATANPGVMGFGGSLTGGSLSITDNTVQARAGVNTASNQLTLAATGALQATGAVNNVQAMDGGADATVGASSLTADLVSGGATTLAVSGNSVTAQASGNLASNALNASGVSGISSSGSTAVPTFAVLNSQSTGASGSGINATLSGTSLGAALNGSGGSTSVQGNQLVALAYGNSVDNTLSMSALPGSLNTASAAITNVQYNMASISASVTGGGMSANGSLSGAGSVNVSGNTITAQAVGNRSVNSLTAR